MLQQAAEDHSRLMQYDMNPFVPAGSFAADKRMKFFLFVINLSFTVLRQPGISAALESAYPDR